MSRVPPLKSDAEVTSQLLAEALPLVREGVNQLLEQRPRDAMAFLAEFFQAKSNDTSTVMLPPKKKKKPINMTTKSVSELETIISELSVTPQRVNEFFSGDPEERARAGIAILQTEHNHEELVEQIIERIKLD